MILETVFCFLTIDCIYVYNTPSIPLPVLYLFYFLFLMVIAAGMYLFPCISRFSMGLFPIIRMSVLLMIRHVISTILLLMLFAIVALGIYLMPWGILIFPGVGFWLMTFLMEPILLSVSPKPEPGSDEAQKWYYQ